MVKYYSEDKNFYNLIRKNKKCIINAGTFSGNLNTFDIIMRHATL